MRTSTGHGMLLILVQHGQRDSVAPRVVWRLGEREFEAHHLLVGDGVVAREDDGRLFPVGDGRRGRRLQSEAAGELAAEPETEAAVGAAAADGDEEPAGERQQLVGRQPLQVQLMQQLRRRQQLLRVRLQHLGTPRGQLVRTPAPAFHSVMESIQIPL